MNQQKIGRFLASCRKEKGLTQAVLAERLGVSDRTISKWENGKGMPDLSFFEPLCQELGITIAELLKGERIQQPLPTKTWDDVFDHFLLFLRENRKEHYKLIGIIVLVVGLFLGISAVLLPTTTSFLVYAFLGFLLCGLGIWISTENWKNKRIRKFFLVSLVLYPFLLFGCDVWNVHRHPQKPKFVFHTSTEEQLITYDALFYQVYQVNPNTKQEYYLIGSSRAKDQPLPLSPFNRNQSGIRALLRYQTPYVGNNSKVGNLITRLPLAEYGYVFQIDPTHFGLTIDYKTTDWDSFEPVHLERALLYNTLSLFTLIDNLETITYHFSGSEYHVTREEVQKEYPDFNQIKSKTGIEVEAFDQIVEQKMNDDEFVLKLSSTLLPKQA